jgi:predicted nucleotidyltransferase
VFLERGFRDRDYLETDEGFFFTVVGNVHPEKRVKAYLKNIPSKSGKWGSGERRYGRALKYYTMNCLAETMNFLVKSHPHYIQRMEVDGITFSSVPLNRILKHHRPEEALADMSRRKKLDALQNKAVELARLLSEDSDVQQSFFGITGSILIGIHNQDFSDLDLIVYGRRSSLAVKKTLRDLMEDPEIPLSRLTGEDLKEWCRKKRELYSLTLEEAFKLYERKWNRGRFKGTLFSVHPVRVEEEVAEKYGDRTFTPIGIVEAEAKVVDSSSALFMPALYEVKEVQINSGPDVEGIEEVVTYEGLYSDLVYDDEHLICQGKLERVEDKRAHRTYYRILIGSSEAAGGDYIKPASW